MRRTAKKMPNADIRKRITQLGLFDWMFAKEVGISASTLCIWMREPLEEGDERRDRLEEALNALEEKARNEVTA